MADYWPQIITGVTGIAGTLLGGSISAYAQYRMSKRQLKFERGAIAAAFGTEIQTHLEAVRAREQVELIEFMLTNLKDLGNKNFDPTKLRSFMPDFDDRNELTIYAKHLADIGKLGALAVDVARFYSNVAMVRATIMRFNRGDFDQLPRNSLIHIVEKELELWKKTEKLGEELVPKLFVLAADVDR